MKISIFAIWKLFAFFIMLSSKNKIIYSKKNAKNKCVCFNGVIELMTTTEAENKKIDLKDTT